MKDPAFLFYASDFLGGVSDLTMEERGQYITMLCLQQQKGAVSEKTIRLSVGSVSVDVMKKFTRDENGNYYNVRLRTEVEKRAQYTESRRINGKKGGRPKKAYVEPYAKPYGEATKNHIEDKNRDENRNAGVYENILTRTFEQFRQSYPGRKRGFETEFTVLQKHSDWMDVVANLSASLEKQIQWREQAARHGIFVPSWANLQTWLNQRRWEDELNFDFADTTPKPSPGILTYEQMCHEVRCGSRQEDFEFISKGRWRRK